MEGEEREPETSRSSLQRVKVYRLNEEGKWDDLGTGHVSIDYVELEASKCLTLSVVDEDDNNDTLVAQSITSADIFRKQEETIITWRDSEVAVELALSFQEAAGCSYIWDNICGIQRNLQFGPLSSLEVGPRPIAESFEASRMLQSNDESYRGGGSELRVLPPVELSSLPLILKSIVDCSIAGQMRVAELISQDHEFFAKLLDLFRMCEDLENLDGLHMIFRVVKGIILLNSMSIFERIFSDELILDVIGALEYDPDVSKVQSHRSFLKEHVVFREAIPIKNPAALSKIHQTYRIGYIKDVILPRLLDDATMASLNTMIQANNAAVINLLKDDAYFIQELFDRMQSSNTSPDSRRELVFFLHEFCSLSKSLQHQSQLFRDLSNEGVFDIISDVLQSQDKKLVLAGTDILILFLNQDPNLLRTYIIQQEGNALFGLLVKGMITDYGEDMHCQFLEILRILMDSFSVPGPQRDAVVEIFYHKHLDHLVDVIASACCPSISSQSNLSALGKEVESHCTTKPDILLNICELLCFCVIHHPFKIKRIFLLNNTIEKILTLTKRREKFLVVAAVRFIRTTISCKDEVLLRHIVKYNLLKPVIEAFIENGSRYNMLQSGVLELFEYIKKECKPLISYVVETFSEQLTKFQFLDTVQSLRIKYEQSLESLETTNRDTKTETRKRTDERGLEKEEEEYFNEDSDEEDSTPRVSRPSNTKSRSHVPNGTKVVSVPNSPLSRGLVDYDDDDDDVDYHPPPRKPEQPDDDESLSLCNAKRRPAKGADGRSANGEGTKRQKIETRLCSNANCFISKQIDSQNRRSQIASCRVQAEANGEVEKDGRGRGPQNSHQLLDHRDSQTSAKGDYTKSAGSQSPESFGNQANATDSVR